MRIEITEDFQNSWIYQDEKKIKWLFDLCFLADEDGKISLSIGDLARRWGVERMTVSRFIKRLRDTHMCDTLVLHLTLCESENYKGGCYRLWLHNKEHPLSSPSLSSPIPPSITPPIIPQEKNSERVACAYTREEDFSLQVGVVATIERYAEQYKTEGMWSDVAMINHIKVEQVKEIFAEFVSIQKHNANEYTNYSDFKSHFMNFVRQRAKAIWADKSQQQQQPKKVISGKDIFDVYK